MHPLTRQEVKQKKKRRETFLFRRYVRSIKCSLSSRRYMCIEYAQNFISLLLLLCMVKKKQQSAVLKEQTFSHFSLQFVKSSLHCWCTFIFVLLYRRNALSFQNTKLFRKSKAEKIYKVCQPKRKAAKLLKVISFEYRLNGLIILFSTSFSFFCYWRVVNYAVLLDYFMEVYGEVFN